MNTLPASPDFSHLKKQAKQLLRDAHAGEPVAVERFMTTLPAIRSVALADLAAHQLQLHDAQSVVAREYGFLSWPELKRFVEWTHEDRAARLKTWVGWVYDPRALSRRLAVRMLREEPDFFGRDPWMACARGDADILRETLAADSGWAKRAGGPLGMLPLIAVTHSLLMEEPGFEEGLLACARLLIDHGADVDSVWVNPQEPEWKLSAIYGAAGKTHSAAMTRLLLEAGANPNDNESLYHSVEDRDSTCTRILLEHGVRVKGTNAIARAMDYGKLEDVKLMLQHGGDANEGTLLHHAVLRGRPMEFMRLLVDAGADVRKTQHGVSLWRFAELHGREDVLAFLRERGVEEKLTAEEQFIAACTRGDEAVARAMVEREPQTMSRLNEMQLTMMPWMAANGNLRAVKLMLELGWPREVKTGWKATALNLAVYRGDSAMAGLLLRYGADWRTMHGFNDNVIGTLAWASRDDPEDPAAPRDYLGCARALIEHGVPVPDVDAYGFSAEVTEYFDAVRLTKT